MSKCEIYIIVAWIYRLIKRCLIPFIEENHEKNVILQDNDVSLHSAKKTQGCKFQLKNLLIYEMANFPFSGCKLDRELMGNFIKIIYKNNKYCSNIKELVNALM